MVKINKKPDFEVCLYSPENQFLGILRYDSELLDVLLQVRDQRAEGYYLIDLANEKKIPIDKSGVIRGHSFSNRNDDLMKELMGF
jgi:hypothetical protein